MVPLRVALWQREARSSSQDQGDHATKRGERSDPGRSLVQRWATLTRLFLTLSWYLKPSTFQTCSEEKNEEISGMKDEGLVVIGAALLV